MSPHTQLVIATGITLLCSLGTLGFLGWLLWGLLWDLYDHFMQNRTRRRLSGPHYSVGRDCFRDTKGVTR